MFNYVPARTVLYFENGSNIPQKLKIISVICACVDVGLNHLRNLVGVPVTNLFHVLSLLLNLLLKTDSLYTYVIYTVT